MAAGSSPKGVRSIRVMFFVTVFFWFVSFSPGLSEFSMETWTFTYTFPSLVQQYWRWPFHRRDRAWYTRVAHLYVRRALKNYDMTYGMNLAQRFGVSIGTLFAFPTPCDRSMSICLKATPRVLAFSRTNSVGSWISLLFIQLEGDSFLFSFIFVCQDRDLFVFSTLSLRFVGFRLFGVRHDILLWWH